MTASVVSGETLQEAGLTENTLIIFSSDNGPWIRFQDTAEHPKYGEARMHVGYATPFRDGKGSTWEGGHRVPGVFCWPGMIAPNQTELAPVSTLDIFPTLVRLAGGRIPDDRSIDGRDIGAYLFSKPSSEKVPPFKFFYSASDNKPSAFRVGPWKLHVRLYSQTGNNYGFNASRQSPLLFQVEQDLGERFDRSKEQEETVAQMLNQMQAFERQVRQEGSFWSVN
jgi:arylsulfatase A